MSGSNCRRHLHKVILLGNLGVGKTSMFRRLRDGKYHDFLRSVSNVGVDKHTKAFRMESGETVFVSVSMHEWAGLMLRVIPNCCSSTALLYSVLVGPGASGILNPLPTIRNS